MKVNAVSFATFRSQNNKVQGNNEVNPYLYTATPKEIKELNTNNFKVFLGSLATIAVAITLFKLAGKKLF